MTDEFNLSEKRQDDGTSHYKQTNYIYREEDVKEFIRRLKEELTDVKQAIWAAELDRIFAVIDKLAGEKLI